MLLKRLRLAEQVVQVTRRLRLGGVLNANHRLASLESATGADQKDAASLGRELLPHRRQHSVDSFWRFKRERGL
jgi:hypothetical protein